MAIDTRDHALGRQTMLPLRRIIRECPEPMLVRSGHYVPKQGERVVQRALEHFELAESSPIGCS